MAWMSVSDIMTEVANAFFAGSETVAGLAMYTLIIMLIFAVSKNRQAALVMMLPLSVLFNILGILGTDMTVITLIVAILALTMPTIVERRSGRWQAEHWAEWRTTSRTR